MLPIMDKAFGTWYLPKQWPDKYGIDAPMAPGLIGELLQPFEPQAKPSPVPAEVES
jgi:sterol desaturase/sphingolipid hydroxylase (fatty acid hydroxylase superfamily)